MNRLHAFSAFIVALLLGFVYATVARSSPLPDPLPDPIPYCEPTPENVESCFCDPYSDGTVCFEAMPLVDQPPFVTSGKAHIQEFAFNDASGWRFSTGTYRSGKPDCPPGHVPAIPIPDGPCSMNALVHIVTNADGKVRDALTAWFEGPAYDSNGQPIFGTFDDRLLVTVYLETPACSGFICQHVPSEFSIDRSVGATFDNGVPIIPGLYNFNRNGDFGRWYPIIDPSPQFGSIWGYFTPNVGPTTFTYSSVFGNPVGVTLKGEPIQSPMFRFYSTAFYEPWLALDFEGNPTMHRLPEPDLSLGLAASVVCLAGAFAVSRRRG